MFNIIKRRSTHSGKLERWAPPGFLEEASRSMKDWYGPDIAMACVPGKVYARKGGDFVGEIDGGGFAGLRDLQLTMGTGFANIAAMRTAWRNNKRTAIAYNPNSILRTGTARCNDTWRYGGAVGVGGNGGLAANAPGGSQFDRTTTGALNYINPPTGETTHFVSSDMYQFGTDAGSGASLLLTDRLFGVNKTMNSIAAEAVTGVPLRYQSTNPADDAWIGGNFAYPYATTTLANTAHNHVTCTYTDENGAASTFQTAAGVAQCQDTIFDLPAMYWFMPLEAGDVGVGAITQIQTDAAIATGALEFIIAHPIAFIPVYAMNFPCIIDAVGSALQLERILDDACLNLIKTVSAINSTEDWTGTINTLTG